MYADIYAFQFFLHPCYDYNHISDGKQSTLKPARQTHCRINNHQALPSYNVKPKIIDFSDFFKLFYLIKQS